MGPSPPLWLWHAKQRLLDQNCKSLWLPDLFCGFVWIQNSVFCIRITSLYGTKPSFVAFAFKTATFGPELQVSMCPTPHLWFFAFKTATLTARIASLYGSQTSSVVLCVQKSVIINRITSLHWSQTSAVVLCM